MNASDMDASNVSGSVPVGPEGLELGVLKVGSKGEQPFPKMNFIR